MARLSPALTRRVRAVSSMVDSVTYLIANFSAFFVYAALAYTRADLPAARMTSRVAFVVALFIRHRAGRCVSSSRRRPLAVPRQAVRTTARLPWRAGPRARQPLPYRS